MTATTNPALAERLEIHPPVAEALRQVPGACMRAV